MVVTQEKMAFWLSKYLLGRGKKNYSEYIKNSYPHDNFFKPDALEKATYIDLSKYDGNPLTRNVLYETILV